MIKYNTLKNTHFAGMTLLMVSVAYMLVSALRQAGQSWWLILSLSGHSSVMVFLILCLYLFAVSRGVGKRGRPTIENPLTSSDHYLLFYSLSPFIGALAGATVSLNIHRPYNLATMIAGGTMLASFLAWIVIDSAAGLIEIFLPESQRHRLKRLALAKAARITQQKTSRQLLAGIETQQRQQHRQWQLRLSGDADRLTELIRQSTAGGSEDGPAAVQIAVKAWQIGGNACMQYLHDMTLRRYEEKYGEAMEFDYLGHWWDGVGNWHSQWARDALLK